METDVQLAPGYIETFAGSWTDVPGEVVGAIAARTRPAIITLAQI
jgi:hypothetical protein